MHVHSPYGILSLPQIIMRRHVGVSGTIPPIRLYGKSHPRLSVFTKSTSVQRLTPKDVGCVQALHKVNFVKGVRCCRGKKYTFIEDELLEGQELKNPWREGG